MADSLTQPDIDRGNSPTSPADFPEKAEEKTMASDTSAVPSTVIWTPRFIVLFALALILGLSADSLLTEGWLNHLYAAPWALLGHVALLFCMWIVIIVRGRSWWVRMGGIFGGIWSLFIATNFALAFYTLTPTSPIPAQLDLASSSALLGCYICLSIARVPVPFNRWDSWFFPLALLVSILIAMIVFFLTPPDTRSLMELESTIATTNIVLSLLVWWIRSSCWKAQPGVTLLLGMTPALTLLLSIPRIVDGGSNFFITLVGLLSLFHGTLRIIQGELRQGANL